jgi:hypothetical protein
MAHPTPAQQRAFFETFGFLKLPGLVRDELPSILAEFEAVFPQLGIKHDGAKRTMIVPFVDQRAGLCALLDHAKLRAVIENLIGPGFNYLSSDGNYYTGDTAWHLDSDYASNAFIKMAFYLDPVTRDTGALRVIPGTHREESFRAWNDNELRAADDVYGCGQRDLPAVALETQPGDVLFFNHRLRHASFGGSARRRMFTLNLGRRAGTPQEIDDLVSYISWQILHHTKEPYGETMLATAGPTRKVHFAQVFEHLEAGRERQRQRLAKQAGAV